MAWKKEQLEQLRAKRAESEELRRQREQELEDQKEYKRQEADKAYQEWLLATDRRKADAEEQRREAEDEAERLVEEEAREKKELADEAYRLWVEMKKQESLYTHSLAFKILSFEEEAKRRWPSTPWLPTGNSVPRQFVSSGDNRRKTLEKPLVLTVRGVRSKGAMKTPQTAQRAKSAKL